MINNIAEKNKEQFINLGFQVNEKFDKLFSLDDINSNDNNYLFGYYVNNYLLGFIHVIRLIDELEIINVVVDKKYRNRGIGSKLIEYVISNFNDVKNIFLEVNTNNKNAIKLYEKYNFSIVNIRKKYYGNDDCYVMRKEM